MPTRGPALQRTTGTSEERADFMCGVFGLYAPGHDVARTTFFALYALQHRGQESAGIATCDGRSASIVRGMGRVTQVFDEKALEPLKGVFAIGHTRYSTTGSSHLRNAQPHLIETIHGPLGVSHNGNLTNASRLRRELLQRGVGLGTSSDSEVITQMLAAPPPGGEPRGADWEARIRAFMSQAEGAYSLVLLTREAVFAVRDPLGLRPLVLGEMPGNAPGWVVASESSALATIGARYLREVEPGEIVRLDKYGVRSIPGRESKRRALCVFEYVYFARPDSLLEGQTVHRVRQELGAELWREAPLEADLVVGVPDSATPAAIGFARASGLPYSEGLTKNRYIGRTFIHPDDRLRQSGVKLKYNPLADNLRGQRVVLLDDSIVRGNTIGPLVKLLREGGATEVHLRISSPPVRFPCFMGIDMATHDELIGHRMSTERIRQHVGADSLAYLSHGGMMRAVTRGLAESGAERHCSACFTGVYPLEIAEVDGQGNGEKLAFEAISGS